MATYFSELIPLPSSRFTKTGDGTQSRFHVFPRHSFTSSYPNIGTHSSFRCWRDPTHLDLFCQCDDVIGHMRVLFSDDAPY